MTIANRLAQLAAEPSPSRCPVCGFDSSDAQAVRACAEREALVESRREAMRAWLDRAAGHPPHCACRRYTVAGIAYPCDCAAADEWRDFEGAEPPVDERDWYELLWLAAGVA